jgi:hypothetical protein
LGTHPNTNILNFFASVKSSTRALRPSLFDYLRGDPKNDHIFRNIPGYNCIRPDDGIRSHPDRPTNDSAHAKRNIIPDPGMVAPIFIHFTEISTKTDIPPDIAITPDPGPAPNADASHVGDPKTRSDIRVQTDPTMTEMVHEPLGDRSEYSQVMVFTPHPETIKEHGPESVICNRSIQDPPKCWGIFAVSFVIFAEGIEHGYVTFQHRRWISPNGALFSK